MVDDTLASDAEVAIVLREGFASIPANWFPALLTCEFIFFYSSFFWFRCICDHCYLYGCCCCLVFVSWLFLYFFFFAELSPMVASTPTRLCTEGLEHARCNVVVVVVSTQNISADV